MEVADEADYAAKPALSLISVRLRFIVERPPESKLPRPRSAMQKSPSNCLPATGRTGVLISHYIQVMRVNEAINSPVKCMFIDSGRRSPATTSLRTSTSAFHPWEFISRGKFS